MADDALANTEAMAVMEPVARDWRKSRAIAFSYGSALASIGRKSEAQEVFDSLDPHLLSPAEAQWMRSELR